jgi:hypothetical protein
MFHVSKDDRPIPRYTRKQSKAESGKYENLLAPDDPILDLRLSRAPYRPLSSQPQPYAPTSNSPF